MILRLETIPTLSGLSEIEHPLSRCGILVGELQISATSSSLPDGRLLEAPDLSGAILSLGD